jgi:hypothetical protein
MSLTINIMFVEKKVKTTGFLLLFPKAPKVDCVYRTEFTRFSTEHSKRDVIFVLIWR